MAETGHWVTRRSSRYRHLQVLRQVGEAVSRSLDLDEVLGRAVNALGDVTGHEISSLHLLSPDGQQLLLKRERGLSPMLRDVNLILPVGRGLIGGVAATGAARRVDDVSTARDLLPEARAIVRRDGIRAFVCVPIKARERILGTLSLGRQTGGRFSDHELTLLECAADQIGLALDNARLYGETRRQLEELERARTAVVRAERLSAVGELAAGVAHELNNPLTVILAQAHLLGQADITAETRRGLVTIEGAARRAATVVRDLVLFAEPRAAQRRPCQPVEMVHKALTAFETHFRAEHVLARVEAAEDVPVIWADPDQLLQVLVQLVENARYAMVTAHGGGTLVVRVQRTPLGVMVRVEDDGPGVAPEHQARVFTPFFTTKGPDEGRGLGLAIAHGVVREHGGRLSVQNRSEGGAVFAVELPNSLRRGDRNGDSAAPAPSA